MARNYHLQLVLVVALSYIFCSHNSHKANAQSSAVLCRSQCQSAYEFYRRFITSTTFLNNYLPQCYERCPPLPSTTPTTPRPTTITTKIPRYGDCGLQTYYRGKIVGGDPAQQCEFPWMVAVTANTVFCGGAILDKRHILTAAHCLRDRNTREVFSASQVYVRVGSSNLADLTTIRVSRVQIDSRHVPVINDYDVAILTLSVDLVYSDCVAPICLPQMWEDPFKADFCVAAGWGVDTFYSSTLQYHLQKVTLPLVPLAQCQQSYGTRYVNDLKICAGDWYNGGIDTCQGDSGGPLMCYVGGRYVVHGIVSFGSGCARSQFPGIYTRVSHEQILGFIKGATGLY